MLSAKSSPPNDRGCVSTSRGRPAVKSREETGSRQRIAIRNQRNRKDEAGGINLRVNSQPSCVRNTLQVPISGNPHLSHSSKEGDHVSSQNARNSGHRKNIDSRRHQHQNVCQPPLADQTGTEPTLSPRVQQESLLSQTGRPRQTHALSSTKRTGGQGWKGLSTRAPQHPKGSNRPSGGSLTSWRPRVLRLGIEAEIHIVDRSVDLTRSPEPWAKEFVQELATNYNNKVPPQHPRMHGQLERFQAPPEFKKWAFVEDNSIAPEESVPYAIELVSPTFEAAPQSRWRDDVEAMWDYLAEDYLVGGDNRCGTHIHVSMEPRFTAQELKRIAQAVIHFEPAFEVLVPQSRRGNQYARSNWLECPDLGPSSKSRLDSILALNRLPDYDERAIIQIFSDRRYSWSFMTMLYYSTVEFRKPPFSTTAAECLQWAELALSFIQACVRYPSVDALCRVPPNVHGLRWFVSRYQQAGVNEPARLDRLWHSHEPLDMLQPVVSKGFVLEHKLSVKERQSLRKLAEQDAQISRLLVASQAREPYW